MAQKSSGMRNKTRRKLAVDSSSEGVIADRLREFDVGDRARIDVDSRVQDGMPHPRFHGRTGEIVDAPGTAYVIAVKDGGKTKEFAVHPVHLSEV